MNLQRLVATAVHYEGMPDAKLMPILNDMENRGEINMGELMEICSMITKKGDRSVYQLRELAQRWHKQRLDALAKIKNTKPGNLSSKSIYVLGHLSHEVIQSFRDYEALAQRLMSGQGDEKTLLELEALPPTESYPAFLRALAAARAAASSQAAKQKHPATGPKAPNKPAGTKRTKPARSRK